jgi:hypothetical protein
MLLNPIGERVARPPTVGIVIPYRVMRPLPPPPVPGKTDWERFDNAVRKVFTVTKEDLKKDETEVTEEQKRTKKLTK